MNNEITSKSKKTTKLENIPLSITNKPSVISKSELNAMLFKIKKYHNDLKKLKIDKSNDINNLKIKLEVYDKKIQLEEEFKDIELENENISVKEVTSLKETKEEIREKIEKLIKTKKTIEEKYLDEQQYTHTLNYMIQSEKDNLERINENLITSQEKIVSLKYTRQNFLYNIIENKKKREIFGSVNNSLDKELKNLSELMNYQNGEILKLTGHFHEYELEIEKLKNEMENINSDLAKEIKIEKENLKTKIIKRQEEKNKLVRKETEYIKLILGLHIIKKYFIDIHKQGKQINNENLIQSEDYKLFKSEWYTVFCDNDMIVLNTAYTSENEKLDISHNKFTTSTGKIYLKDIQEKLDNVDLVEECLDDFYSKLITKTTFFHSYIMEINSKIINLENKKDVYTEKVKNIMKKDYKIFDSLIMNTNSKLKNFMIEYQKELSENRESIKTKFITEQLNTHFFNNKNIPPPLYKEFYQKLDNLNSLIKGNYEFMQKVFINIYNIIQSKPETKDIADSIIKSNSKINQILKNTWTNIQTQTNESYLESLLSEANNSIIKSKLEAENVMSIDKYCEAISTSPYKNLFLTLSTKLEKDLFHFILNIKKTSSILKPISGFLSVCQEKILNINIQSLGKKKEKIKMNKIRKSLIFLNINTNIQNSQNEIVSMDINDNNNTLNNDSYVSDSDKNDKTIDKTHLPGIRYARIKRCVTSRAISSMSAAPVVNKTKSNLDTNQQIIDKFYKPFIDKRSYNTNLNKGISDIKHHTRNSAIFSHHLKKKKKEIECIQNELTLYKNPNINLNDVSNNTYNFYVKYIISKQNEIKNLKEEKKVIKTQNYNNDKLVKINSWDSLRPHT